MRWCRRSEQVERRCAEIAADADRQTCSLDHLSDERGDRAFTVGTGDASDRDAGLLRSREQFDVTHQRHAALGGAAQHRLCKRYTGRDDDQPGGGQQRWIEPAETADRLRGECGELGAARRMQTAVSDGELPAERGQMARSGHAAAAKPHDERGPSDCRCGVVHRSLSVARPASTRKKVMIQKRTMIFGSAQPFFS